MEDTCNIEAMLERIQASLDNSQGMEDTTLKNELLGLSEKLDSLIISLLKSTK